MERIRELVPLLDLSRCYQACEALQQARASEAAAEERAIRTKLKKLSEKKENLLEFIMVGNAGSQVRTITRKLSELEEQENALAETLATVRLRKEKQALEVTEAVQSWFLAQVEQLQAPIQSPEWKRAVQTLFRIEWDWAAKTGEVFLVPMFAETHQGSVDPIPGSMKMIRSAQNSGHASWLSFGRLAV